MQVWAALPAIAGTPSVGWIGSVIVQCTGTLLATNNRWPGWLTSGAVVGVHHRVFVSGLGMCLVSWSYY